MSTGYGEQIINPSSLMWTISPTGTFALALELDALRERTHVRNPNPGNRRARLAGAVHRDDRHLDSGAGKFVTDFLIRSGPRDTEACQLWRPTCI